MLIAVIILLAVYAAVTVVEHVARVRAANRCVAALSDDELALLSRCVVIDLDGSL